MEGSWRQGSCDSAYSSVHPGNIADSLSCGSGSPLERPSGTRSTQSFPRAFLGPRPLLVAASPTQAMDADWPVDLEPLASPVMHSPPSHHASPPVPRYASSSHHASPPVPRYASSSYPEQLPAQGADTTQQRALGGAQSCGSSNACSYSVDMEARATSPSSTPRTVQRVLLADRRDGDAVQRERQQLQQWLARNAASVKQLDAICATSTWDIGTGSNKPLPPPAFLLLESCL